MTKSELHTEFIHLCDETMFITKEEKAKRGKDFEEFLHQFLLADALSPRTAFRPEGEEIDGSFLYAGRIYLLELKWQKQQMPASTAYAFKGKVDGKLVGTIGIFISMSGFSTDCVEVITQGKMLNIILVDGNDLKYCISKDLSFEHLLKVKLRKAAEYGLAFYSMLNESKDSIKISAGDKNAKIRLPGLVVFAEGSTDQIVFQHLANLLLKKASIARDLAFYTAGSKSSMARLASAIFAFRDVPSDDAKAGAFNYSNAKFVLIVDADNDTSGTEALVKKDLDPKVPATIIVINPELEVWFQEFEINNRSDLMEYANKNRQSRIDATLQLLNAINIDLLLDVSPSFKAFRETLLK